ncbi:helix-turn-helix transcriptional regulator [Nocardioides sp. WS12]|uniref:helix-turn-helix domain-containing protein n=1 Tax=Nocardioides sp. WS12 TaxID=2486272 RepID=UPI0015F7C2BF|nr:helix-turn-helix transcriptional regulator [Nocardioides sp. WS12]
MDRAGWVGEVFAHLGHGTAPVAATECAAAWDADRDPVAAALAAVCGFWQGDFAGATAWAERALAESGDDETRALALAAAALASAGDPDARPEPAWSTAWALLEAAPDADSAWWTSIRYLLAESALVGARLADAQRVVASGPMVGTAWAGHPFAAMMVACAVRTAVFSGQIDRATALIEPMRAATEPGSRLEGVVEAVAGLVLGNADDASGVSRSRELTPVVGDGDRDFVDRGVLLLLAFGAIAIGDIPTAARLVFQAGDDGDLGACTIIDRALGLEMLVVAALAEEDLPAAETWLANLMTLAEHPTSAPTVDRVRSRYLLVVGDVEAAVAAATASIEACRAQGRGIEAAEGEIVLARARIAGNDVAGASRDLRALVNASDASGHRAVRRSAASTLQPARRRLPPVAGGGWEALSEREREIARCVLDGLEVDQIATDLFLSPATVRTHVSRVLCAFGVPTRIGLLAAVGEGRVAPASVPTPLSPRQSEVARLVAGGASNQQVADELGISVKGVEKHVGDILERWNAGSRFEVARIWWGSGAGQRGA